MRFHVAVYARLIIGGLAAVVALVAVVMILRWASAPSVQAPPHAPVYIRPLEQTPPPPPVLERTPLHEAAIRGDIAEVRRLLREGAEIDALDGMRRTPLWLAAQYHGETALVLLDAGAQWDLEDREGVTPVDAAADPVDRSRLEAVLAHPRVRAGLLLDIRTGQQRARLRAIRSLGRPHADDEVFDILIEILGDPSPEISKAADSALRESLESRLRSRPSEGAGLAERLIDRADYALTGRVAVLASEAGAERKVFGSLARHYWDRSDIEWRSQVDNTMRDIGHKDFAMLAISAPAWMEAVLVIALLVLGTVFDQADRRWAWAVRLGMAAVASSIAALMAGLVCAVSLAREEIPPDADKYVYALATIFLTYLVASYAATLAQMSAFLRIDRVGRPISAVVLSGVVLSLGPLPSHNAVVAGAAIAASILLTVVLRHLPESVREIRTDSMHPLSFAAVVALLLLPTWVPAQRVVVRLVHAVGHMTGA